MMLRDMVDSVIVLNDEHCKGNGYKYKKEMKTRHTTTLNFLPYIILENFESQCQDCHMQIFA